MTGERYEKSCAAQPWLQSKCVRLNPEYVAKYLNSMEQEPKYGLEESGKGETVIVDYGGANVAKPLHVGHLRSAIIGESIKRMGRFLGA